MQYKQLTDCAIKGLRYLADVDKKCVTTFELADYLSMSRTTVQNFMRILRRNTKWIRSLSGTEGGYVFTGDAEKITLYAIHKAMEDEARSSDIVDRSDMMLYSIYKEFARCAKAYFSRITLQDLVDCKTEEEVDAYMMSFQRPPQAVETDTEAAALRLQLERLREERDKIKTEQAELYNKMQGIMNGMRG